MVMGEDREEGRPDYVEDCEVRRALQDSQTRSRILELTCQLSVRQGSAEHFADRPPRVGLGSRLNALGHQLVPCAHGFTPHRGKVTVLVTKV